MSGNMLDKARAADAVSAGNNHVAVMLKGFYDCCNLSFPADEIHNYIEDCILLLPDRKTNINIKSDL